MRSDREPGHGPQWVGRPVLRFEDDRFLRGAGRFIEDLGSSDSLHVRFVRSPLAHASVSGIDPTGAERVPGVVGVYTWRDFPTDPLPPFLWDAPPEALIEAIRPSMRSSSPPLLAQGRARYVGQPVAVVVAESRADAEDGAEQVDVDYEGLPPVRDPDSALRADSPLVHDKWGDNIAAQFDVELGDPDHAFSAADLVVGSRLTIARQAGVPIETRGALARYDPESGLTLWSSTQNAHPLRNAVARVTGLGADRVRVIVPDVGGGFGIKGVLYPEDLMVSLLAIELRTSIRWIEDRTEHFLSAIQARDQVHDIELALTSGGRILGLRDRFLVDCGAYNPLGVVLPYNTLSHLMGVYDIRNLRAVGTAVVTNKVPNAPYRGAGRPEAVFAVERVIDMAARRLSIDPVELRRRNLIDSRDLPKATGLLYRDGRPLVLDSGDYRQALDRAAALVSAGPDDRALVDAENRGLRVGTGYAFYTEGTGIGPFEGATVRLSASGEIEAHTGASSQGQAHETTLAQVCADHVGLPIDLVSVTGGDTARIERGWGTVASRVAVVAGNAIAGASEALRQRCLELASADLGVPVEALDVTADGIRQAGSDRTELKLAELALMAGERGEVLEETAYFEPSTVTWSYGVHAATVAVDVETGDVSVLRYVVVHDCGNVINPMIVNAQIHGGVAQGIGEALLEEIMFDDHGQPLNASLGAYAIPTARDVPSLVVDHLETPSPLNPLGLKGVGEGGAVAPPAAVANAVDVALEGIATPVRRVPITPQYVRSLLA